jgi:flagellar biosynthesis protein FliQ
MIKCLTFQLEMKIKWEFNYILWCNNYLLTFPLVYVLFVALFSAITLTSEIDLSYLFCSHRLDI